MSKLNLHVIAWVPKPLQRKYRHEKERQSEKTKYGIGSVYWVISMQYTVSNKVQLLHAHAQACQRASYRNLKQCSKLSVSCNGEQS